MSKTVLLLIVQFSISTQFSSIGPIGPYQVLPLRARVDLGVSAMKLYSALPKAPVLLELTIRLFSVISRIFVGRVLPFCREAFGVFNSTSRLGKCQSEERFTFILMETKYPINVMVFEVVKIMVTLYLYSSFRMVPRLNKEASIKCLEEEVLSWIERMFTERTYAWRQDYTLCHTSKRTQCWLKFLRSHLAASLPRSQFSCSLCTERSWTMTK